MTELKALTKHTVFLNIMLFYIQPSGDEDLCPMIQMPIFWNS